jgi:enediyne biosynthesis protein E4
VCLADLDNDGDLDVIANNLNEAAGIYRNDSSKPRVAVRLKGLSPNTQGIGAKIIVRGGAVPMQSQEIISGGRYLSCDQAMRTFAAGALTNVLTIEVRWPSGRRSIIKDAVPNYRYEIDEAAGVPVLAKAPQEKIEPATPLFVDVSDRLSHSHHEDTFDDFARQPTLPKRLSQLGPGLCWCDLTGNGRDDLVIASGKGGHTGFYLNQGKGVFKAHNDGLPSATEDQTAIVQCSDGHGKGRLLVGSSNYEISGEASNTVSSWESAAWKSVNELTFAGESIGTIALGDLDGDGNLDLFVAGRVRPGRYPEPVSSRVYRWSGGAFHLDEENNRLLQKVGMVSAAVWSDLDGDGFPELILACEWGPILIFHNDHGRLSAVNAPLSNPSLNTGADATATETQLASLNPRPSTMNQLTGWWNGVTTADLDGDGQLDIIASNWGSNSKYQNHRAKPLRLYYGDFAEEGSLALLEAYYEPAMEKYVPERRLDVMARSMPFLRGRFTSYQAYADSGVDEILGDRAAQSHYLEVNWLESTALLNRGGHFEPRLLPQEAQFAPAFAVVAADFDGDGTEDIFLSQNFFAVEPETSRCDAGRGVLLKGDGRGGLLPMTGVESGIKIYGEQRGAAAADFDGDGRVDLAVSQNGAETRLLRNTSAKPGLRVRLQGPPGNPRGIGVQMRLKHGEKLGPVREVHGGSGYWSQDSPVQVLSNAESPSQIWLRWPGGKTFVVEVPAGAKEVVIGLDGKATAREAQ